MVEYVDGSVLAQLGNPDMRTPIAYGLAYPDRIDSGVSSLDIIAAARLDFENPNKENFPCHYDPSSKETDVQYVGQFVSDKMNNYVQEAISNFTK